MKKHLLTAVLGLFGFVGAFTSADTVGNLTSDSQIYAFSLDDYSNFSMESMMDDGFPYSDFYACISSEDTPFYMVWDYYNGNSVLDYVNSPVYCSSSLYERGDFSFYFYSSYEDGFGTSKSINGNLYVSTSPITYNSPSEGGDDNTNGSLISNGTGTFSGIINSLGTTISEFIPYVVYIGLGLLGAVIGFVAIKRLMNYTRRKVLGTFSSRKRR